MGCTIGGLHATKLAPYPTMWHARPRLIQPTRLMGDGREVNSGLDSLLLSRVKYLKQGSDFQ